MARCCTGCYGAQRCSITGASNGGMNGWIPPGLLLPSATAPTRGSGSVGINPLIAGIVPSEHRRYILPLTPVSPSRLLTSAAGETQACYFARSSGASCYLLPAAMSVDNSRIIRIPIVRPVDCHTVLLFPTSRTHPGRKSGCFRFISSEEQCPDGYHLILHSMLLLLLLLVVAM